LAALLSRQDQGIQPPEINYLALAPLLVVFGAGCLSVLLEAFWPRHQRWSVQVLLTVLTLVGAGAAMAFYLTEPGTFADGKAMSFQAFTTIGGTLAVDRPALFLWGALLALGLGAVLLIADRSVEPGGAFVADTGIGAHISPNGAVSIRTEVFPLFLFSLGGMMTFVAANDLLTMFIALEVLSLPLYLLCGLARRRRLISQEAAVKYFLLGAFASAFFLYGLALLYGYSGSVKLADIADASGGSLRSDTLLFAGLGLLVVGLLFKASVGPFHTWTPDVYQGAPTPITAFMAVCTKVAAFGAIMRVLTVAFKATSWEWRGVLWAVAIVSMAIGAVLGLTQSDIKRMIAYSSIAHAGFLLVGAMAMTPDGLGGTMFYLVAYGFTTLAVFGVISLVRDANGEASQLAQWAGLSKRSPLVAAVFTFLLLALAGIPLTSGFVGKFAVFEAAVADGMTPLVVIALIASGVAAFFYLRVIVLMYFREPAEGGPTVSVPGVFTTAAITLGTLVTLLLGVAPTWLLKWASLGGFGS
jgi:NADH-quinone oxidoreductase subunit N